MGTLRYDRKDFDIEDRALAHMQIVISIKLRRHEPFVVSWKVSTDFGSGRHALWIDNAVPIHISFAGTRGISINRLWIEQMLLAANRPDGLQLGAEPVPEERT